MNTESSSFCCDAAFRAQPRSLFTGPDGGRLGS